MHGQLIINEVLYDPSNSGLDGDANGDGVYDQEDDSFIEFYNSSNTNFDMSGYQIWDDTTTGGGGQQRYVIPSGTLIPPRGVLVVFGAGPLVGNFGGAVVLSADTASSGLSLNNSGEVIIIKDANGNAVLSFDSDALSNNPNESYTLYPDVTGTFIQHNDSTPLLFSPGTRTDGTPFDTNIVVTALLVEGMGGVDSINTSGGTLQMVATASPASADDKTVTWSLSTGSANATISASGVLTAVANGSVTVVATANDVLGTVDSTTITLTMQSTGLGEITNEVKVNLYPNPASNQIAIETDKPIDLIEVYTIEGKLVKTENTPTKLLNIEDLKAGNYVLKVRHNNSFSIAKFIKQ